jgi:hypothetical protein
MGKDQWWYFLKRESDLSQFTGLKIEIDEEGDYECDVYNWSYNL